jgi:hypothetical protein
MGEPELPESATWHPLDAAREYEKLAEEACGKAHKAFKEYARLREEFVRRKLVAYPDSSVHALAYLWKGTEPAMSCASDVATYSNLAQMYAALATMKHTRATADPKLDHRKPPWA